MIANNPMMQLIGALRKQQDPAAFMINLMQSQMGNNPLVANFLKIAQGGPANANELHSIAQNLLREQGFDFDKEFSDFRQILGL